MNDEQFRDPSAVGLDDFSQYDNGILKPNSHPGVAQPWNDPVYKGYMDPRVDFDKNNLSKISEVTAIGDANITNYAAQNATNDLMALRRDFPNMPIIELPAMVGAVNLPIAYQAADLLIPQGAVVAMFSGNQDYYMCLHGNADVPGVNSNTIEGSPAQTKSFFAPEKTFFYVSGIRSISVCSPFGNTNVTCLCWVPKEWPR
jgi:hypothetical protein